jgi:hypothetical protein
LIILLLLSIYCHAPIKPILEIWFQCCSLNYSISAIEKIKGSDLIRNFFLFKLDRFFYQTKRLLCYVCYAFFFFFFPFLSFPFHFLLFFHFLVFLFVTFLFPVASPSNLSLMQLRKRLRICCLPRQGSASGLRTDLQCTLATSVAQAWARSC